MMKQMISDIFLSSSRVKAALAEDMALIEAVALVGQRCKAVTAGGGTIYACGNGGSTCDAMHFTEELVGRYKRERPGIRAMHFMEPSVITCWSNDYEFRTAYSRQAETFCGPNDILFAISTSGKSENIIEAVKAAKRKGAETVALTGKTGEPLRSLCDYVILVPSSETERIQEAHITIIHALCELMEHEAVA